MMKSVAPPTTYVPIPQPPPLRQRRILTLTLDQENILLNQFKKIPRAPHREDVILLAAETGLTEEEVQDWFVVKIAQWRKEQGLGGNLDF